MEHVEQMAELVDSYDVDVFAFGLATDFRSLLFPAARRLFELADEVARIQVEVLCWCGREGLLNARVVDGRVVREGEQVVIGDTVDTAEVRYQVLCRRHYRTGDLGPPPVTRAAAEPALPLPERRGQRGHRRPASAVLADHRQSAVLTGPAVAGELHGHRAPRRPRGWRRDRR